MIDIESLLYETLASDSYDLTPQVEADLADRLPTVLYQLLPPVPLTNGPWQNGAVADVMLTVFASTRPETIRLMGQVLDDIEALPTRPSRHGWVSSTSVVTLPWRPPGFNSAEGIHSMQSTVRLVARSNT